MSILLHFAHFLYLGAGPLTPPPLLTLLTLTDRGGVPPHVGKTVDACNSTAMQDDGRDEVEMRALWRQKQAPHFVVHEMKVVAQSALTLTLVGTKLFITRNTPSRPESIPQWYMSAVFTDLFWGPCLVQGDRGLAGGGGSRSTPAKPKPRFPQKPQFGPTDPLIHSVQFNFLPTHPSPSYSLS